MFNLSYQEINCYFLIVRAKPARSERDSSGTTEARSHEMASAKVMERIARREERAPEVRSDEAARPNLMC
jgi:hypothetical protein